MRLEDQVCSLELAKKLKELGVKQDSLFYWLKEEEPYIWFNPPNFSHPMNTVHWNYSAFTVAELLDIIPPLSTLQLLKGLNIHKGIIFVLRLETLDIDYTQYSDFSAANACAKMLIYLIENGIVKV